MTDQHDASIESILSDTSHGDGIHRLCLDDGRAAVLKRRSTMPTDFFAAEAHGLKELARAGGLRGPELYGLGTHAILIEDLGAGRPGPAFFEHAGLGLARQHHRHAARFGFEHDGWCGDSRQENSWQHDGFNFFAENRLLPQTRRARDRGRLGATQARRIERLCLRLNEWLPRQPAVLVHGDLWTGNLHCCADGEPALIDTGAVHYGWAEADLAMLVLFGSPPESFFAAYREQTALAPDWRERAPLYNLYHLLNHLNLFGAGYLPGIETVLDRYA